MNFKKREMNFVSVKFISEPAPNQELIFRKREINLRTTNFISENRKRITYSTGNNCNSETKNVLHNRFYIKK